MIKYLIPNNQKEFLKLIDKIFLKYVMIWLFNNFIHKIDYKPQCKELAFNSSGSETINLEALQENE